MPRSASTAKAVALWCQAYGLADLENEVPATPSTQYRLASISKQFTAAAVLLLAEEKRLSLDDAASRWLPSLRRSAPHATLRQLLIHTSGVTDFEELIAPARRVQLHDAEVPALLEARPGGYFAPGSGFRYSNTGYVLLALIVERASGMDFAAFLRTRIFSPLGMQSSVAFEEGVSSVEQRAFGYRQQQNAWVRYDQDLTSATLGDGGIYSSVGELAHWDAALSDGRLFKPATLHAAFYPWTKTEDPAVRYGFGWRLTVDSAWHSGETAGFRNVIVRFGDDRLTVVVLTNRDESTPYRLALAIARRWRAAS